VSILLSSDASTKKNVANAKRPKTTPRNTAMVALDDACEILDSLPNLTEALAQANPELRRRVFDAFRLAVALDRNAGQIRVKALISSAFTKSRDLQNLVANRAIDLIEPLSHTALTEALERLTTRSWPQAPSFRKPRTSPADARRKFASVSDAVVQVLADAPSELRFIEIYEAVDALLEGQVARSSVKNALASESSRRFPRFERVGHGRYRTLTSEHGLGAQLAGGDRSPRVPRDLEDHERDDEPDNRVAAREAERHHNRAGNHAQ
jgi:hypothetical protein